MSLPPRSRVLGLLISTAAVAVVAPTATGAGRQAHATVPNVMHFASARVIAGYTRPTNVKVTSATQTSIAIAWQAPKSSSLKSGQASYRVYLNGLLRTTTTSTAYTFSGLGCGKSATLGVSISSLTSPQSTVVAATSPCVGSGPTNDTQPPSTPGALTITGSTASSISVAWSPAADNVAVAAYEVSVDGAVNGSTSATGYTVSGLSCGTSHQVSVDAVDSSGNRSAQSAVTAATAGCPDTLAPQPPNVYVTGRTATSVGITWTTPLDNVGVADYAVYVNDTRVATVSATSYTASGLTCGTSYTLGVAAFDAAGNASTRTSIPASTIACSDTTPPAQPADIQWISATAGSVSISWTAATDNVGVAGYTVYQDGVLLRTTATNSPIVISGLACGTTYKYAVDAYDAAGNHSARTSITTWTNTCVSGDTTAPTAPTGLTASAATQTGVTLSWTASTDNVGVTGYTVYVGGSVAGQAGTSTTYAISGLTCGTSYSAAVEAKDAAGNVSPRSSANVTTAACAGAPSPPATAQLFVATNGNDSTCTRGDSTKPCASFKRAYQLAQLGDTVQVAAGTYPAQLLTDVSGKTSSGAAVTFQANGTVNLTGLNIGDQFSNPDAADNLKFVGFHGTTAWNVLPGANNITFDHVQTTNIYANGTNGYTVTNSDFGNCTVTDLNGPCDNFKVEGNATNVLIDHDTFHDFRVAPGSSAHFECMFLADSHYVTISNSSFTNCEYYDIFTQTQTAGVGHVTVTANTFDLTWASGQHNRETALNISDRGLAFDDWALSGNTFATGSSFTWDSTGTYSNFRFTGNRFGLSATCMSGATYSANSWTSGTCN